MEESQILAEIQKRSAGRRLVREYANIREFPTEADPGLYPWQEEFHNAGLEHPERLLMAANRTGKTRSAAAEVAIHATGIYPPWWKGRRFEKAVKVWTGAESAEDSRNIIQNALLGDAGAYGTGWIPRSKLKSWSFRQAGITEVVETIVVEHVSGGLSVIRLKTYQQEARGWRGESLDVVWADELIPPDIYTESQTRLIDRKGLMIVTFTPMEGPGEVVRHFMEGGKGIYLKNVTWDDITHLDPDEKERLIASYPAHERDSRTKGQPMLGSGSIFAVAEPDILVEPFEIPEHWARINGIDFGIDHPAAGAFCAWDRDADTFYMYDGYKKPGETPVYHIASMRKHGDWIPNAWPLDGLNRDKGSGVPLKNQYRGIDGAPGLYMLSDWAQYPDNRKNSVEAALIEMLEWMKTDRFKVFNNHAGKLWMEEKRLYHRKDGKVITKHDDIISASRYAFMMRRYAKTKSFIKPVNRGSRGPLLGRRRWKRAS